MLTSLVTGIVTQTSFLFQTGATKKQSLEKFTTLCRRIRRTVKI